MSSRTQDKIYETFVAITGGRASSQPSMIDAGVHIAKPGTTGGQIRTAKPLKWPSATTTSSSKTSASGSTGAGAQSLTAAALESVFQSVPLLGTVTSASNSGGGIGSTIESLFSTVLKSGLGAIPLVGGLLGLFGGGGSAAAPTLTKYAMPSSIAFEGADTASGIGGLDYGQAGAPRVFSGSDSAAPPSSLTGADGSEVNPAPAVGNAGGGTPLGGGTASNAPAAQNVIDTQSIDARWFMDRSADIAAAVRDAMLNSNAINDVVNEL